jgi:hypothetical protein
LHLRRIRSNDVVVIDARLVSRIEAVIRPRCYTLALLAPSIRVFLTGPPTAQKSGNVLEQAITQGVKQFSSGPLAV